MRVCEDLTFGKWLHYGTIYNELAHIRKLVKKAGCGGMPSIPALRKQEKRISIELQPSLVYTEGSRPELQSDALVQNKYCDEKMELTKY